MTEYAQSYVDTLVAEITRQRILLNNLAYQCRIILDYWPEFQLDMQLPIGKQLWRRTTEKYLDELDATSMAMTHD